MATKSTTKNKACKVKACVEQAKLLAVQESKISSLEDEVADLKYAIAADEAAKKTPVDANNSKNVEKINYCDVSL